MKANLPQDIKSLFLHLDSKEFNVDVYNKTGLFIVRQLIPQETISKWQSLWNKFHTEVLSHRKIDTANPVNVTDQPPGELGKIYSTPELVNLSVKVHGKNTALYNQRFVIKDSLNPNKVMLHQDSCYHLGYLNKCSFFVPIFDVGSFNGGLEFYPGTHKYGYLGDAGEINPEGFVDKWDKISPTIYPGDVVVMHSSLWHSSPPNESKTDRILVDIITQPANDPTGEVLLNGVWETDLKYNKNNPPQYFKSSRILKLKKLTT